MFKTPDEFAQAAKALIPQVKFNKNGYEIRTQVLEMAKDHMDFQFGAKFQEWENTVKRDPETGHIINKVKMPEVPGVDQILETAEKFYEFVNNADSKK
tara:strand:+ start:349 stop:642 length:294 start_codon:yes stop_codon:yes gene_type:complete